MCAKCARRIGNPQKPQKCSQVHTKIAPDQFAQYVARATKFPTGLWRERSVSEREIFYAVFACQRTLEHYRNIPELSSLAMTDPTATRRRGGTMEVAPQRTITKSRRSGYDPEQAGKLSSSLCLFPIQLQSYRQECSTAFANQNYPAKASAAWVQKCNSP